MTTKILAGKFQSDGCTLSPDKIGDVDISQCCEIHDRSYDFGDAGMGTADEVTRWRADQQLRLCIMCQLKRSAKWWVRRTASFWGRVYLIGTRLGGYSHYRWNPEVKKQHRWRSKSDRALARLRRRG